jgi:transcriptional regulator with XRE-family HTH domain
MAYAGRGLGAWRPRLGAMTAIRHLTTEQLAERLGVAPGTLRKWRQLGTGPAYIKAEGTVGTVRYRLADVEAWERKQLVTPWEP